MKGEARDIGASELTLPGPDSAAPGTNDRLSDQQINAILAERARALAKPERAVISGDLLELITFEVAGESYAIETRFVLEVLHGFQVALLPGAGLPLMGLTLWRGEVLPLLNARSILELPQGANPTSAVVALVLGIDRPDFAVEVDEVFDLRHISAASLLPRQADVKENRSFLHGTTTDALLVLDGAALIRTHG